jgi:hypothetical protein
MFQKHKKTYVPAGFEPVIFCSVGERDDHYTTPPGQCHYARVTINILGIK